MNFKKFFKPLLLTSPSLFLIASACGVSENTIDPKTQVVMTTSQGPFWPLIFGLNVYGKNQKGLIPYYNQKFKDDPDFAPVRLVLNDESKANTQQETTENIKKLLDTNSDQLPSIVLGDSSTASVLQGHNRLLEINSDKLNPGIFTDQIVGKYNSFNFGENKFYNIPFNVNDVDALGFNLDNLRIIFDLVKKGGGNVDETAEIYKKAQESAQKGNSTPENSFFSNLEVKSTEIFKDLDVNYDTFSNIEEALEFSTKFIDGVKLKADAKIDENTQDASIFDIDYSGLVFHKNIISKSGKKFWEAKDKDLTFNIATDTSLQDEFKKTYEKFTKTNKKIEKKVGNKNKILQAFQFKDFKKRPGIGEWGSHDILKYRTVFGYVPGVGIKQSIDTATSRNLFADKNPELAKGFATFNDVFTTTQPLKSRKNSQFFVYNSGGSSLIPIKTDTEKINKAAIKFLEWLFTGQNDIDKPGTMVDNTDYLMENTGYFLPTKSVVTQEKLEQVKKKYQEYYDKIVEFESNNRKSIELVGEDAKKIDWSLYEKMANLRSVIISMESMLNAFKEDVSKVKILSDNGNFKEAKISATITDSLIQSTRFENSETKSSDQLLKLINE
ncbi:P68 family surface lipoprotein [Mesomycoplasma ovipneumoniae]|uniref:P68 family surface lipoprotein n=1 Tax=Mesomycoplasma ovipneumoniae TaxID=29562 RepID=UPI00311B3167